MQGESTRDDGGITPWQAYDALFRLGSDQRVKGFDLVEVDPSRDIHDITARLATKLMLTFLAGYHSRPADSMRTPVDGRTAD